MPARLPVALSLRTRRPFPIRVVVSALRSLADDLADIAAGRSIHLSERVKWLRKNDEQAEAWLYLLHIVCDKANLTPEDCRKLANQYQSVMRTRRTPVRKFTAGGPRLSPALPMLPVELTQRPPRREVDQA